MNDERVVEELRRSVADVRMTRPLDRIEHRGRQRRRNRGLLGAVGGGGAVVVIAGLALALPAAAPAPEVSTAGGPSGGASLTPVAFEVKRQADQTVELILRDEVTDPQALRAALASADVPAQVEIGKRCTPVGAELPEAEKVYRTEVAAPGYEFALVITPKAMPAGSELMFSIFRPNPAAKGHKMDAALVARGADMTCVPMPSQK
ncbi:hypothetical protein ACIBTV_16220 [Micromonospora sp. NPDC049366]|uniref:hypothetical protein n=1 Tax=Micromonospora sp. NPDC049366 TaxID=3364271 RepID=UPI0037B7F940